MSTSGARVYQSRLHALRDSNLPCLLIDTEREEISHLTVSAQPDGTAKIEGVVAAQTGGVPDKVTCVGVGKKARRYLKFHCTAHVTGEGEYASDGFSVTVKVTVNARPFRVLAGWK